MADELKGRSILLVDDDQDILLSMKTALTETGADIETVSDGDSAVRKISESRPDLLVLDVMLPKRSGFLVLEKIRQTIKKTDPPRVIMITGNPGTRHRVYAETLGIDMYLNKPFRIEKLVEAAKDLLTSQG
ncbi:MAG: response regulator [Planctomycetota bacterium]|nr:response regulator [Planctomycetota bacterium]